MKRIVLLLICLLSFSAVMPQKATSSRAKQTKTTVSKKTTTTKKKTTTTSKKSTSTKKKTTTKAKPATKQQLQNKKSQTRKKIALSKKESEKLAKDIKQTLDSVVIIDGHMKDLKHDIDSLQSDIDSINRRIRVLDREYKKLQAELQDKKDKYAKSLVYLRRQKSTQQKMMFIFSAENFSQMIRRMRYLREYSAFQKAQGEQIKMKQAEVQAKQAELNAAKAKLQKALNALESKKKQLETMKENCEKKVKFLNTNLQTVQKQLKQYEKEEAELDKQIEKIIQQEIAEAKRKAEEARKKREAEARRKTDELQKEQNRKLEAALEAKRKAEEDSKNAKTSAEKKRAKEALDKANKALEEAKKEEKEQKAQIAKWISEGDEDLKLSNDFAANKGRLPIPITGAYNIVGHFGKYNVPGLKRVVLDNKGMDIRGREGASARAVFDGEVSSIFKYGKTYIVMLRHGSYISVYSGLTKVSVKKGAKLKTRDTIGTVGKDKNGDTVLHFQLRKESAKLNPELWIR